MLKSAMVKRVPAALCAALLGATLGIGLSACGDEVGDAAAEASSQSTESQKAEPSEQAAAAEENAAPAGLTGEPLPEDWPADILVPNGELILVLEIGTGYNLTVEGVDIDQARGIIAEMAAAGLQTEGPTDTGRADDWTASATSATHMATYSYEDGGAGLPNVTINLMPAG